MLKELIEIKKAMTAIYDLVWMDAARSAKPLSCEVKYATAQIVAYNIAMSKLNALLEAERVREEEK